MLVTLQAQNPITLNTLISDEVKVDGIVMLSTFSLPLENKKRKIIYKRALRHKKELHFILDELLFNKIEMIENIENYLIFRNKFFTQTKNKTNNFEKYLAKFFPNFFSWSFLIIINKN